MSPTDPPYRLHFVPCLPHAGQLQFRAIVDYFRAVWKASDKIDFDAGIGARNEGGATQKVAEWDNKEKKSKSQTNTCTSVSSLSREANLVFHEWKTQEGSFGLHE